MQKLEFDSETVQQLLGIGKIRYMSVVIVNNEQLLRIDCEENTWEYQRVKASKSRRQKPVLKSKPDNYKPKNKNLQFDREVPAPNTGFGAKAAEFGMRAGKGALNWIRTPPRKKPEDW